MTHEDAFVIAILTDPRNLLPGLVFADWLEERGQYDLAEAFRACKMYRPAVVPECRPCVWAWYRGKVMFPPSNPAELPWQVFRHLRPMRGNPEVAQIVNYLSEDDAIDDMSKAANVAWADVLNKVREPADQPCTDGPPIAGASLV